ncbi:MAG: hypothetical protein DMF63_04960 [Acidobacteria bacterium]|nr:MAG: hypothetical protein DMF63_04960 [Acidobacteriota bacterium]
MADLALQILHQGSAFFVSRSIVKLFCALLLVFAAVGLARSQSVIDDDLAPPPVRVMSPDEKSRLAAEVEIKRRTKLALELMDLRLKQAEKLDAAENYDPMYIELGAFHGIMDNTLEFLNKSDKESGKVLNNFKRFEIGLRAFIPRLEFMRHDMPIKYEHYLRSLGKSIRAARSKAVENLFDDTVVPDKKPENSQPL